MSDIRYEMAQQAQRLNGVVFVASRLMVLRERPIWFLHERAKRVGLRRRMFRDDADFPHYDVSAEMWSRVAAEYGPGMWVCKEAILVAMEMCCRTVGAAEVRRLMSMPTGQTGTA